MGKYVLRPDSIRKLFDTVAPSYDFLNRLLSVRRDVSWRREAVGELRGTTGWILDLATGTGDVALEAIRQATGDRRVIGIDFSEVMIRAANRKILRRRLSKTICLGLGDGVALPFRDNYADIIVSRGSFHFWKDQEQAFKEIYRVLKPGAAAYIGRGFSPNLPVETARKIRSERGGKVKYDVDKTADELRGIMNTLGIAEYTIHRPKSAGDEDVNYGVWVEFHKK